MKCLKAIAFAGLLTFGSACFALKIGDKAPDLNVKEWIKGTPIKLAQGRGKNIFVVEFWATWCPPCKASIPHLDKLQKMYKKNGLIVIGISNENPDVVKKFVARQKSMDYRIAIDNSKKTSSIYMGQNSGIPQAFIINKAGIVVWSGHPMSMDKVLEQVIAGKFDSKKAAKQMEVNLKLQKALKTRDLKSALKIVDDALKVYPKDAQYISLKAYLLFSTKQPKQALAFIDQKLAVDNKNSRLYQIKMFILQKLNKDKELQALYSQYIKAFSDKPALMVGVARQQLTQKFGNADLAIALKAATLAYNNKKTTPDQKSFAADTLARCYYMIGRVDKAIEIQKIAYQLLKKAKSRNAEKAKKTLNYYIQAHLLGKSIK
jgi:thiol-disulfide isomerase/thioredoxin